jgi:hypothetical protein
MVVQGSIVVLAGLVVIGCTAGGSTTSTSSAANVCGDPPATEVARESSLIMSLEPNPVVAGSQATLSVAPGSFSGGGMVGAGAQWQCWNGTQWVDTYQIVRGFGSGSAVTLKVQPGATTTVPAIGLPIPNSYPIIIPDVKPGIYRIRDTVEPDLATGFVIVQVVANTTGSETATTTSSAPVTTTAATTSTTAGLDTTEATGELEELIDRAEAVLAASGDRAAFDEIANEADRIGGLVSDESTDPRYGATMNTVLALLRAGSDGLAIGPLLYPDSVTLLAGEGVAIDVHGLIVLIDIDGTVIGHLDGYRIDYRFTAPGPVVLRDVNNALWVLDGNNGLRQQTGVPLADGSMLVVDDVGWEIRQGDTVVFAATNETTFEISAHRDLVTATHWAADGQGSAVADATVAIDLADGSELALPEGCVVIDRTDTQVYLACTQSVPSEDQPGGDISEIRTLDGDVLVPSAAIGYESPLGRWRWGEVSPDGSTLLLQWSAECESPVAFFAPTSGGDPVGYEGADDWQNTPESFSLGWTWDAHALVLAWGEGLCGVAAEHPGVYLMNGPGDGQLIYQVGGTPDARLWTGRN